MKKLLLSLALLVSTGSLCAQNSVGKWSITPMAGINIATMTDNDDSDPRVGFIGGAEISYRATNLLGISFGALYSQQGAKASVDDIDGTIKMDYINVPVLANFYVVKGLSFKVGLQPGFLVNDKVKVSNDGASAEVGLEEALRASGVDGDVKSFSLAIPVGLSYEFDSGIKLDARYNFGVTKALSVESESSKHSVFQFTVGYSFKL